jgi:hypothetical protein
MSKKIFHHLMELASLPLEGSVKQNAAKASPVATLGKYFFFCSSFPNKVMPYIRYGCNKTFTH